MLFGFIAFHSEKRKKSKKWYEITEKGRTILTYLQEIAALEPERTDRFLKLLGAKHTKSMLTIISEHGKTRHMVLMEFFNPTIINITLRRLIIFGLIKYTMEKIEKRREWYEITDKGKKVLQLLDTIVTVGLDQDVGM
jgi:DNA-binding PadR family transcriptional regulator